MSVVSHAWRALLLIAGLRLALQGVLYVRGAGGVERHHLESSGFILALLLACGAAVVSAGWRMPDARVLPLRTGRRLLLGIGPLLALLLYLPILGIGLLSDDYVLLAHAGAGQLFVPDWTFIRPLPLGLWWIAALGGGAAAPFVLHLVNVLLHGANAVLVALVAGELGMGRAASVAAALLFLAFPASVEPVAWLSGMFDVSTAAGVLLAVWTALRGGSSVATSACVAFCVAGALACKETAVAAPVLVFLALAARDGVRSATRSSALWTAVAVVAVYAAGRLSLHPDAAFYPPLTAYAAKELLSRPFAVLAIPFHADVLAAHPVLPALATALVPVMLAVAGYAWKFGRGRPRLVLAMSLWVLASTLPVFTALFVTSDLEGSRYVYLASAGWALGLMAVFDAGGRPALVGPLCAALLLGAYVPALHAHLGPWQAAAVTRDRVLAAVRQSAPTCDAVAVVGLPEEQQGAFVFRNGFEEAVRTAAPSIRLAPDAACRVVLP